VESGSSVLDLVGQIWCILVLLFISVWLWWHELSQVVVLVPRIFDNKAVISSSFVLTSWRNVRRLLPVISLLLPRRKVDLGITGASSMNKRCCLYACGSAAFPVLSAGRGGEGGNVGKWSAVGVGGQWGCLCLAGMNTVMLQFGEEYMVAVACRHDPWPCRRPLQMPFLALVKPPMRRPSSGVSLAHIALATPSGVVPGGSESGRRCGSSSGGGGKGPDCFLPMFSRVLSARFQDGVVFSNFSLSCMLNSVTALY